MRAHLCGYVPAAHTGIFWKFSLITNLNFRTKISKANTVRRLCTLTDCRAVKVMDLVCTSTTTMYIVHCTVYTKLFRHSKRLHFFPPHSFLCVFHYQRKWIYGFKITKSLFLLKEVYFLYMRTCKILAIKYFTFYAY